MYYISEIYILSLFYRKNKKHETIPILNLPLRKSNYFTVAKFIMDDKYNQIIFFKEKNCYNFNLAIWLKESINLTRL